MRRVDRTQMQCWVDVFEGIYFGGRLRRCFCDDQRKSLKLDDPELKKLSQGSLIVGPEAHVTIYIRRGKRDTVQNLKPKQIIPDLAKLLRGGRLQNLVVRQIEPNV